MNQTVHILACVVLLSIIVLCFVEDNSIGKEAVNQGFLNPLYVSLARLGLISKSPADRWNSWQLKIMQLYESTIPACSKEVKVLRGQPP